MSNTPRTDNCIDIANDDGIEDVKFCEVIASFARQLERELAASKADRVAISQQLSDALDALFASNKQLAEARAGLKAAESEIRGAIKLCGEYAIGAREGLYASLALSVGKLKHQIECELAHKKNLSDCANYGMAANEKLFNQLSEARAEIERLRGVIISQITPEPIVLSGYSTSTEPAKDERDRLNSCNTYGVQPTTLKDGAPQERQSFDEPQLELVERGAFKPQQTTGGLKLLLVGRMEETSPAAEPKMHNMQDLSLCHIMQLLHKSEISCGAQFEWDSMLWVWLGNVVGDNKGLRAIEAEECFDISNDEALTVARKWLVKTAQEKYPLAAVWKEVEKNGGVA